MHGLISEINESPQRAEECYLKNKELVLPKNVPYLGMGSSYFAPVTLMYCGKNIQPHIASEYFYYLSESKAPLGVLLSQSGRSSETVWNIEKFDSVVSVTNYEDSPLGTAVNLRQLVNIVAGEGKYSSTKTYVNTLIALYLGLGIDPKSGVESIKNNFENFHQEAQSYAQKIHHYLSGQNVKGLYVIGSGPNIGTAYEGALTLSETTKLPWIGMPVAQYDHGPKEAANDTVILVLNAQGKDKKRIEAIKQLVSDQSNALVVELQEKELSENLSPLTLVVKLNLIMNYLADEMKVGETFQLGGKVTTVDDSIK